MTSETPDTDTELVTVLRNKIAETKQVDGEALPISLTAVELTHLLDRLAEAECLTKPQPCSYGHEEPYDFDYCVTHDRTFARGGECDHKGQSLVNYLDDMSMSQRGRAVIAEGKLEHAQLLIQDITKELDILGLPKDEVNLESTVNKVREQVNLYNKYANMKPGISALLNIANNMDKN